MGRAHNKVEDLTMLTLQKIFPSGRFFKRDNRPVYTKDGKMMKKIRTGEADIWGVVFGRHFEIEIKTGKDVQRENQKNWQATIENCLGVYMIVSDKDDEMSIASKLKEKMFEEKEVDFH